MGESMFQHVDKVTRERILTRDHRRCRVCNLYFGDHRPMDVIPKDVDVIVRSDGDLISVCFTCNEVIQNLRRIPTA